MDKTLRHRVFLLPSFSLVNIGPHHSERKVKQVLRHLLRGVAPTLNEGARGLLDAMRPFHGKLVRRRRISVWVVDEHYTLEKAHDSKASPLTTCHHLSHASFRSFT